MFEKWKDRAGLLKTALQINFIWVIDSNIGFLKLNFENHADLNIRNF
jgi:hypothetical protein